MLTVTLLPGFNSSPSLALAASPQSLVCSLYLLFSDVSSVSTPCKRTRFTAVLPLATYATSTVSPSTTFLIVPLILVPTCSIDLGVLATEVLALAAAVCCVTAAFCFCTTV